MKPGLLVVLGWAACGCSELQARQHARVGNTHFRAGEYAAAVQRYELAEQAHPGVHEVTLNRGLACRQLMRLGVPSPEQECALSAFSNLQQMRPEDPRGEQLYVQTLFEAGRFDVLVARYEATLKKKPGDLAAVNSLIEVYSRAEQWSGVLRWSLERADLQKEDADAQSAVGVSIFLRLYQKGGADKEGYDPQPELELARERQAAKPPAFNVDDVVGSARVQLADLGIRYLQRAIVLRPGDRAAMSYLGLLYRQRAYAFFDDPLEWARCKAAAENWQDELEGAPAGPDPEAQPQPSAPGTPT
jgi:tetratricopeptide (TPR) repeat protein